MTTKGGGGQAAVNRCSLGPGAPSVGSHEGGAPQSARQEWRLAEDESQRVAPDQVELPAPDLAGHLVRVLPEVSPQPEGSPVECVRPGPGVEGGERRRPLRIGRSIAIGEARPRRRTGHVEVAVVAGREYVRPACGIGRTSQSPVPPVGRDAVSSSRHAPTTLGVVGESAVALVADAPPAQPAMASTAAARTELRLMICGGVAVRASVMLGPPRTDMRRVSSANRSR